MNRPSERGWKRLLMFPLTVFAALVVLFEELVWDQITALVSWLAKLHWINRLERWIQTLDPYPTLVLFLVPITLLLPMKILALYFLTHGRVALGITVILIAKVVGTAISARLFVLAKPKLMSFTTFVWLYGKARQFKAWAHQVFEEMRWLQYLLTVMRQFKTRVHAWVNRLSNKKS